VVTGDLAVNGGDLTTSQTTFNLLNTNATTVNFAGVATGINAGTSAAGAVTVTVGPAVTNNTFKISSTTSGAVNITSDLTTGTLNLYTGITTGTVNIATGGASTTNVGSGAATLVIGSNTGNATLTVSGNATTGTATINTNNGVTTANVFNTVSTTGNLFGAGTTIAVGANSGTLTIGNPTVVGTQTTVNLWNTQSTTVNAFGVATGVNIATSAAAASTLTFGPAATGNIFEINSVAGGTINLTSDVTTGIVNAYTGITTGTVNIATGGASTTNIGGAAGLVNIGTTGGDSILTIRGNSTGGTGTITTNAGTASVFNANASTINAFGAGTSINIGTSTGTVTVANPTITMTNGTTFNMNGANPAIASSNTGTASIFNANITTINFGQAAAISMGGTSSNVTVRGNLLVNGTTTIGDASADAVTFNSDTITAPNTLTVSIDDASNASISYPLKVRHTTSGTAAAGMGTGIQFIAENASGTNATGAAIEILSTGIAAGAETFDLVLRTMTSGSAAVQAFRANASTITIGANATATTITTQSNSTMTVRPGATGAGSQAVQQYSKAEMQQLQALAALQHLDQVRP